MSTTTHLSNEDRAAILRELNAMPYGGLVMHRLPRRDADHGKFVEQLVDVLKAFSIELAKVAAQNDRRERELRELLSQRDAIRSFLGMGELDATLGQLAAHLGALQGAVETLAGE